ncbi:MAG: protein kinase [archaeon]|nr:protein kinase [archaeon]
MDLNSGKFFVVKRYFDNNQIEFFKAEVEMYEKLSHPNIISYIGNDSDESKIGYNFIYLEYISCGNLKQLIETYGSLPENLIKLFLKQIIKVLLYLHNEKKVAHRDIKCSNILIDNNGNIKLSDFGCATIIEEDGVSGLKGTLPWCAPEVIRNEKYNHKCDIWSLGCTLIEMAGINPWGNNMDNYYQCLKIIGQGTDLPEIPEQFGDDLKDFIKLCLQRDYNLRADINTLSKHKFLNE